MEVSDRAARNSSGGPQLPKDPEPMATTAPTITTDSETPREPARSALQTTLNVASTAANLVLFPYVVAGRAAYQATSFAVTAPIKVTKHVANTLSRQSNLTESALAPTVDLFGEREFAASTASASATSESSSSDDDAPVVEGVLFEAEAPVDGDESSSQPETAATTDSTPGVVSQLIFLPVRFVSSSVSTAAALPASAIAFGGRTISGAVSTSQSLASSALVASGDLALRTTRHVATGLTHGAFSTAHRVTGLVGSSVRTASYVIPPSVSNALWHGMERTGSVSTNVISYAIAVPTYRMVQALVPEIHELFSEQELVDTTKDGVKLLVKVLGPQNAFYVLKFMYETVNSEEVYDAFLLCQDLVRESLDAENYKKAGSSVSKATGIETLAPVVKNLYAMMPSLDELVDAAIFVGDVADEIMTQAAMVPTNDEYLVDTGRFEYVPSDDEEVVSVAGDGDEEDYANDDSDRFEMLKPMAAEFAVDESDDDSIDPPGVFAQEAFEVEADVDEPAASEEDEAVVVDADAFTGSYEVDGAAGELEEPTPTGCVEADVFGSSAANGRTPTDDSLADLFNASVSFFSSVLDSDETSMLLNTFGDFIDVLVE